VSLGGKEERIGSSASIQLKGGTVNTSSKRRGGWDGLRNQENERTGLKKVNLLRGEGEQTRKFRSKNLIASL